MDNGAANVGSATRSPEPVIRWLWNLCNEQAGVAAVEYAVTLALVGAVSLGAIASVGNNLPAVFNQVLQQTVEEMDGGPDSGYAPMTTPP